jgi:pimeloyl-ACP methyl ester carboxylesterase
VKEFSRDGLVFDVDDDGPEDGAVVVLLHGYPENRTSWAAVAPLLVGAGYRVLAPDQRGYSRRARPHRRRDYRLTALVEDVVALADAAGAERVHVVGHDWGGGVAWGLAMQHPERLRSVSVLSTPHPRAMVRSMVTSGQLLRSWYFLFYQLPWLPELSARGPGRAMFMRTLVRSGLDADKAEGYMRSLEEPGALRAAINWYRAVPLALAGNAPVTTPALYIYSTGDFALGRKAADLTGRYVDGPYRYEVLDGVSHWIPEQAPADVARLLLDHFGTYPE